MDEKNKRKNLRKSSRPGKIDQYTHQATEKFLFVYMNKAHRITRGKKTESNWVF